MHHKAFTLIELLVVVTIIAVLIALLLPSMDQAMRHTLIARCSSQRHQFQVAVATYAASNAAKLPADLQSGFPNFPLIDMHEGPMRSYYGGSLKLLKCPSDPFPVSWAASFWRAAINGNGMQQSDHRYYKSGDPIETEVSYYWTAKMYYSVDTNGVLQVGPQFLHQYKIHAAKHPANLIAYLCIGGIDSHHPAADGASPSYTHYPASFLDGHTESVLYDDVNPTTLYNNGIKNVDWTKWGIYGRDFGGLADPP